MKKRFSNEMAYVLGILILAISTAMMEKTNWGMSMVVAPAYILHLKISQYLPFFSFGMAEYTLQAVLLVVLSLVMGRFRLHYFFSFVTAVIYGIALDLSIALIALIPEVGVVGKTILYVVGLEGCSIAIALFFHSYVTPEAYELFVKEMAVKTGGEIHRVKTIYDIISCLVGVILSFLFFGFWHFEGVKLGTIICALINGRLIGWTSKGLDSIFDFQDATGFRKYFA